MVRIQCEGNRQNSLPLGKWFLDTFYTDIYIHWPNDSFEPEKKIITFHGLVYVIWSYYTTRVCLYFSLFIIGSTCAVSIHILNKLKYRHKQLWSVLNFRYCINNIKITKNGLLFHLRYYKLDFTEIIEWTFKTPLTSLNIKILLTKNSVSLFVGLLKDFFY